jgi:hypothetical protein
VHWAQQRPGPGWVMCSYPGTTRGALGLQSGPPRTRYATRTAVRHSSDERAETRRIEPHTMDERPDKTAALGACQTQADTFPTRLVTRRSWVRFPLWAPKPRRYEAPDRPFFRAPVAPNVHRCLLRRPSRLAGRDSLPGADSNLAAARWAAARSRAQLAACCSSAISCRRPRRRSACRCAGRC